MLFLFKNEEGEKLKQNKLKPIDLEVDDTLQLNNGIKLETFESNKVLKTGANGVVEASDRGTLSE